MTSKTYPTRDVITVTTGVVVSPSGIGGVYEICGFMLDQPLMTHQLPDASRACETHLYAEHPWLADLTPPKGDPNALMVWIDAVVSARGEHLRDLVDTIERTAKSLNNSGALP